ESGMFWNWRDASVMLFRGGAMVWGSKSRVLARMGERASAPSYSPNSPAKTGRGAAGCKVSLLSQRSNRRYDASLGGLGASARHAPRGSLCWGTHAMNDNATLFGRVLLTLLVVGTLGAARAAEPLKVGVFAVDASPPLGSPMAYDPTKGVVHPLS